MANEDHERPQPSQPKGATQYADPLTADHGGQGATRSASVDELGSEDGAALVAGEVVADRYRIVETIGKGGMGTVYRADHVHIRKSFALKVLHRELTHHAEAVRRFEREAIAAARIDHPNVATAIDFGRLESGAFYLVLDHVQGRSLRSLLEEEHQLSEVRTLRIGRQIASALAAAHAAGIVHRDLKPDNVMLVEASSEPDFIKVLDFGIAKLRTEDIAAEPAITRFGTVFGTPEYMSPEQALGQSVDARSDLYALGIMLYEMLAGRTPFADEQLVTVLTRQMTEEPAPLADTIAVEIRMLVMQLLQKRPEARPASAELVLSLLDAMLLAAATAAGGQGVTSETMSAHRDPTDDFATGQTLLGSMVTAPGAAQSPQGSRAGALVRRSSLPPWLKRPVAIAGRRVPLVAIVMGATLFGAGVILASGLWAIALHHGADSAASAEASVRPSLFGEDPETKQLRRLMEQASNGDPVALQRLEERPAEHRDALTWLAIASGRAQNKQWTAAVAAYEQAFRLDPRLVRGDRVPAHLYQAVIDAQATTAALELVSEYLGATGADLVYAALEASSAGRASKIDRRKAKSLLESGGLSAKASPALRVALRLEAARSCGDYKSLLADSTSQGDQRAYRLLRKLNHDRGCGLLGLMDCYSCLRGGRALAQAIEATRTRPSPVFLEPQQDNANAPSAH